MLAVSFIDKFNFVNRQYLICVSDRLGYLSINFVVIVGYSDSIRFVIIDISEADLMRSFILVFASSSFGILGCLIKSSSSFIVFNVSNRWVTAIADASN